MKQESNNNKNNNKKYAMFLSFEILASALQLYVIRAFKVMTTGKGFDFSVKKVRKLFARPCALSKPHDKGGDEYGKAA